jgi:hypothetical protein
MEKATVIALLEKYWRAETSVEEEKALMAWFNAPDAAGADTAGADLEPYRALFTYFGEESKVSPGPDFEARILQYVGIEAATPIRKIHSFRTGLTSAAAIVAAIMISLFLLKPDPTPPPSVAQTNTSQANAARAKNTQTRTTPIKDTYDNPQQALAAVRHALLIASAHLNEGRRQFTDHR